MGALAQSPACCRALLLGEDVREPSRSSSPGYLIGLTATLLLSFTGILISYLNRAYQLPSLVLAFWRDTFVVLGLVAAFALFSRGRFRLDRPLWSFFLLYGLSLSLFNSMWTFSVQFNGAAVATVLAFSSPAMTAVLAHFILHEPINRIKLLSIALSLLTGFTFACYNMLGKTSANRRIDPWTTMLYGFSSAVVFLFVFNVLLNGVAGQPALGNFLWLGSSIGGWAVLFLFGTGPSIGVFGLYLVSLGYLPVTVANLIGVLEPVFSTMWAYLLFHEALTGVQVVGSLLVFASVILLRFGEERTIE